MAGYKFFTDTRTVYKPPHAIVKTKIVFVEGQDECDLLDYIFSDMQAKPEDIEIISYNGKDKFEKNLDALLKQPVFDNNEAVALAVFQDADGDFMATQKLLFDHMDKHGLSGTQLATFTSGTKFGALRYGAYIFPDNMLSGNLETLLMRTVADEQKAKDAIDFVDRHTDANDKHTSKRKAQAYLSVQKKLCRGAGHGARDGYYKLNHTALQLLHDFLAAFSAL